MDNDNFCDLECGVTPVDDFHYHYAFAQALLDESLRRWGWALDELEAANLLTERAIKGERMTYRVAVAGILALALLVVVVGLLLGSASSACGYVAAR